MNLNKTMKWKTPKLMCACFVCVFKSDRVNEWDTRKLKVENWTHELDWNTKETKWEINFVTPSYINDDN